MLKKIVGIVAPFLGTMIGGPFGAAATKLIAEVLLDDPNASQADIEQAIASASPDQLVKLKQVDANYKTKMAELGIDEVKIAALDRESARKREALTQDRVPAILAIMLTLGFFGILITMMFYPIPTQTQNVIDVMLGALGTAWISCITYYFGSSYGSLVKTQLACKE